MKITEYYDIYVRFLSKIEDEYLASLDEDKLHVALYPLLLSAINSFARISEHNLRKRDERARVFYETLSDDEIEVLVSLGAIDWRRAFRPYLDAVKIAEAQKKGTDGRAIGAVIRAHFIAHIRDHAEFEAPGEEGCY